MKDVVYACSKRIMKNKHIVNDKEASTNIWIYQLLHSTTRISYKIESRLLEINNKNSSKKRHFIYKKVVA